MEDVSSEQIGLGGQQAHAHNGSENNKYDNQQQQQQQQQQRKTTTINPAAHDVAAAHLTTTTNSSSTSSSSVTAAKSTATMVTTPDVPSFVGGAIVGATLAALRRGGKYNQNKNKNQKIASTKQQPASPSDEKRAPAATPTEYKNKEELAALYAELAVVQDERRKANEQAAELYALAHLQAELADVQEARRNIRVAEENNVVSAAIPQLEENNVKQEHEEDCIVMLEDCHAGLLEEVVPPTGHSEELSALYAELAILQTSAKLAQLQAELAEVQEARQRTVAANHEQPQAPASEHAVADTGAATAELAQLQAELAEVQEARRSVDLPPLPPSVLPSNRSVESAR